MPADITTVTVGLGGGTTLTVELLDRCEGPLTPRFSIDHLHQATPVQTLDYLVSLGCTTMVADTLMTHAVNLAHQAHALGR